MSDWKFQPARDFELKGIDRHRSLVRENGLAASMARLAWWLGMRAALPVWHQLRVTGREHLPAAPPFVLIANHTSLLDAPILASLLRLGWRDRVFPVAASDAFFEKRTSAAFADWFLNALAIRRRSARTHDLDEMRSKLTTGEAIFIIFPEGTRSRTGELQAFHSGIGRLVAQTSVPVLPCHLDGCFRALPPGRRFSKPGRISVKIGQPIRFDDVSNDRSGWDAISATLREAVKALSEEHR